MDVEGARLVFERAARRVIWAWLRSLAIAVLAAAASLIFAVWIDLHGGPNRPYAVLWALFAVVCGYNVSRFVPRTPESSTTPTADLDTTPLQEWVAQQIPEWRPRVRLTPYPEVDVTESTLVLGVPLLMCLREPELAVLLADCHELWRCQQTPSSRRAWRITRGGIGRGIEEGNATWLNRRLAGGFYRHVTAMVEARAALAHAQHVVRGDTWGRVAHRVDVVQEGWEILARQWLAPALSQHVWHDHVASGLRDFIDACETNGLLEDSAERLTGPDLRETFPELTGWDTATAEQLLGDQPHNEVPTAWVDHPGAVTEATWRSQLAIGLAAAQQATGTAAPATLHSLLRLVDDGWGDAIAALIQQHPNQGASAHPGASGDLAILDLMAAATALTLLETRTASLTWQWPFGTVVLGVDGHSLPVREMASNTPWLRSRLSALGVDPSTPLWLAEGNPSVSERAIFGFAAFQGHATRVVVITDRATRVFATTQGKAMREYLQVKMRGPSAMLRPYFDAVDCGNLTDQVAAVLHNDVVRASFSPMVGGHWWRLRIRDTNGHGIRLRGNGTGHRVERAIADRLGERLRTRWLHAPALIRRSRAMFGYVCIGMGGFGLITAASLLFKPHRDISVAAALIVAACSLAILAAGFIPELIAVGIERHRGTPQHRPPAFPA